MENRTPAEMFHELPWHDAELCNVRIPRSNPGHEDRIVLEIRWPDETCQTLTFVDCRFAELHMNFGIIALESILTAEAGTHQAKIDEIQKRWDIDLGSLSSFEIEMNSTASRIVVIARDFELRDVPQGFAKD